MLLWRDSLSACFEQFDDLLDGQLFGAEVWGIAFRLHDRIDLRLVQIVLQSCRQLASQEFSPMEKECSKSGVEEFEIRDTRPLRWVGSDSENGRVDFRLWPKNGRWKNSEYLAIPKGLHPNRQSAVVLARRRGCYPFSQFFLDGYHHSFDQRCDCKQVADDWCCHVVRKVGDQFEFGIRYSAHRCSYCIENFIAQMVFISERIAREKLDVGKTLQFLGCERLKVTVDFYGDNRPYLRRHGFGQRTQSSTDFEDYIARGQVRSIDQDVEQIEIDEEVLAVLCFRLQTRFFKGPGKKREGLFFTHAMIEWL